VSPLKHMIERARAAPKHIVPAEGHDARIIAGAYKAAEEKVAHITLLGEESTIRPILRQHGDAQNLINIQAIENANPLTYANTMVQKGEVDGSIAGAINTTPDVVRSALQIIGMDGRFSLVSSFFIMLTSEHDEHLKNGVIFSDCGLVIDPDAEQLSDIALAAADNAQMLLSLEPKIAMLSFSTQGSAKHALVKKVQTATQLLQSKRPDLCVDGDLQFDAAIIPEIAALKAPKSKVAGQAKVFIFPDLNAGNIGYKIAERLGGAKAVGPILQGLNKPANDLSRGCSAEDVFNMIVVTVLQAQALDKDISAS